MYVSLLLALLPQTSLWIVDDNGGPGTDFTTLQAAVDAAADGDVILVHAGEYLSATIDGKGLSLIGALGASVVLKEVATCRTSGSARTCCSRTSRRTRSW